MRAVVQRVASAQVTVDGELISKIDRGLLVLAAIGKGDQTEDCIAMARKIAELRIFEDDAGKMNWNVKQVSGSVLLVSQFTLFGDVRKGNRPSFDGAELPAAASQLFDTFAQAFSAHQIPWACGRFRAHMQVALVNDGPVTILLDSRKLF
jgi:D-tyrosyl-tRNA(Tyr) deacylase